MPHDDRDKHQRVMVRVAIPESLPQMTFHYDCEHNQLRSVVGRVLGVVPHPTQEGLDRLYKAADEISQFIPMTHAQDLYIMPNKYTGLKKTRYLNAADSLCNAGLRRTDASVKMFVKAERFDANEKINPDPRAIQFRAARYCVAFASFLQPIEHYIYNNKSCSKGVPKSRNVAKGLNAVQRAHLLMRKAKNFNNPVFLMLDASRFDKHVHYKLLLIIHYVYRKSNAHPVFAIILTMQLISICFSSSGLKYIAYGRRMSGDMDTAAGNCLLMLIMLLAFMVLIELMKWDCLDDGDDCCLIVEFEDYKKVEDNIQREFLNYGHELKVEKVAFSPFQATFCRSNVIEYAPEQYKFVRNYRDVMAKAMCGIRNWLSVSYRKRVLKAIGTCELVLNVGVPILEEWALAILRNLDGERFDEKYAPDGLLARYHRDVKIFKTNDVKHLTRKITSEARWSFYLAFDVPAEQQVFIENQLAAWTFDVSSTHFTGMEWDVATWSATHSNVEMYPLGII